MVKSQVQKDSHKKAIAILEKYGVNLTSSRLIKKYGVYLHGSPRAIEDFPSFMQMSDELEKLGLKVSYHTSVENFRIGGVFLNGPSELIQRLDRATRIRRAKKYLEWHPIKALRSIANREKI